MSILRKLFSAVGVGALAVLCTLTSSSVHAQSAPSERLHEERLTEDQVLSLWLERGREVESLRSKVAAARFDLVTAALWPNPQLAVSGGYLVSGEAVSGKFNYFPQLTVPLPIFGQIGARKDEARANLREAEVEVLEDLWERSADVRAAMLERAFAEAEALEIQENLDELKRITRIVSDRARAGANSSYDVLRVATTDATFRAALATARARRDRAESRLVSLVTAPEVEHLPITRAGLAGFAGPESESALVALALQRRPDLELARRGVVAAHASAARFRREALPIPNLSVGPSFTSGPGSTYISAGLSFPLPFFDRNQGAIGKALSQANGQSVLVSALEQRVRLEVGGAWRAREDSRAALEAFRGGGLQAIAELRKRAEVSYEAGTFQILDLLDAYRAVWDARAQALELERGFAEAETELEHAIALLPARSR